MSKICPLFGMVIEEGHPSPIGCYGKQCALWDKDQGWCKINTMVDALHTISQIMEATKDVF